MKITPEDINKEGFAVLHGKWGGDNKTQILVGVNGKKANHKSQIGYLAYPNPKLKNTIPDRRFYGYEKIEKVRTLPLSDTTYKTSGTLEQSVTKAQYLKKIARIKELLAAGEIYQMCYCIRFRKRFEGDPYALFLKSVATNPTDFAAYINCGDFQIMSASPERLFKVEKGEIMTQPIKGTAPKTHSVSVIPAKAGIQLQANGLDSRFRGNDNRNQTDQNLLHLLSSVKERAELDMITDLERNDIGRICDYGTLKLTKERALMELPNLWHTYSEVHGKLTPNTSLEEILTAMFPGGSITGCPKKRAMHYIEELEALPRNIFTGSIGYIESNHKSEMTNQKFMKMDFNITIRTALIQNGFVEFWAGGGIVADSNPEKEYDECLLKAEKFLKLL